MKLLATTLTACVLFSGITAEAQDRFGYRPNYTALRQGIRDRVPSYRQYYNRNNGQYPRYDTSYLRGPAQNNRYSGGISDRYSWAPIYQFYNPANGDQLLTAGLQNEDVYAMQQYANDGMFYVQRTGGAGKIPLFRYLEPNSLHSFTTSHLDGSYREGILGYLETRQTSGTVPLYGWYDPYAGRYLVTTNPNSQMQGQFEYLGVLGYVMPG